VIVPRSGKSATSARLIGNRNAVAWKNKRSCVVSVPRSSTYSASPSRAMAKTSRERLKRQPSSSAAATTVKGKTVVRPDAVPARAGTVSNMNAASRIAASGISLEKMRFIGPVTVRF
jgi:hypothetical protein